MSDHVKGIEKHESHQKGCVSKHETDYKTGNRCSYRWNGYVHMSTAHASKYNIDFTIPENGARLPAMFQEYMVGFEKSAASLRTPDNPKVTRDAWWFTRPDNYKTAYLPFNHNYHHILPATSLAELGVTELQLLQEAEYNLNGKENMIILPCTTAYAVAIQLPDHPYGHVKYNKAIKEIVNELKGNNQDARNTHKITPQNVQAYKTKLLSWQARQFNAIVAWGKVFAATDAAKNAINRCPIAPGSEGAA